MDPDAGFMTIRSRRPNDANSIGSADSTYGSASDGCTPTTHDISRTSFHVKNLETFATALQESAARAFPNRGRPSQRYSRVQALLLHWTSDDLFVLPELEDLEKTLREDYSFETDIFGIPTENSHLELMLKVGDLVKKHEGEDTLFLVYYGGHARIDESRQSTWCATRHSSSAWLQWSAIQTLLERSVSDVLILLDCCAGAASATFPKGQSITETISASSWDAIAPDPGRYSFTNALIEVLQEWRHRTFSAAMLHAEVLARLKHPRPILINGKHFEARSTPVHFMMTSNHKAPSIEFSRTVPDERRPPSPPLEACGRDGRGSRSVARPLPQNSGSRSEVATPDSSIPDAGEPNEDQPHVMISLALEDDQRLDLKAWEQWLSSFPALAKFVKVQGVFKSHSTLLLLSLPVMVWDLLPDDPACGFVAFIRSNNLIKQQDSVREPVATREHVAPPTRVEQYRREEPQVRPTSDVESMLSGATFAPLDEIATSRPFWSTLTHRPSEPQLHRPTRSQSITHDPTTPGRVPRSPPSYARRGPSAHAPYSSNLPGKLRSAASAVSLRNLSRQADVVVPSLPDSSDAITRKMILNQTRSAQTPTFVSNQNVPEAPRLAKHVINRLEDYFQKEPQPTVAVAEFLASNLGVEVAHIHLWFHHRREQEKMNYQLQNLRLDGQPGPPEAKDGFRMILPGDLNTLLDMFACNKNVLLVDLRSSIDFEKSHIHNAINLRAPLSFIQNMTLEAVQDTFVDDQSRRTFSKWHQARCMVFYDRVVEWGWECPVADVLYEKFRRMGWRGECFILKGHYREFSVSFDQYISGSKMTGAAKKYLDRMSHNGTPSAYEAHERHVRYEEWLQTFESKDPSQAMEPSDVQRQERTRAVEQHQQELEAEFETRFPAMYLKSQKLRPSSQAVHRPNTSGGPKFYDPSSRWRGKQQQQSPNPATGDYFDDTKAQLVGPLASGLVRMREAAAKGAMPPYSAASSPGDGETYTDKLGETTTRYSDDYDKIDVKAEGLKNDPAFQLAGHHGGSFQGGDLGAGRGGSGPGGIDVGGDDHRRVRKIWNRLRPGGK